MINPREFLRTKTPHSLVSVFNILFPIYLYFLFPLVLFTSSLYSLILPCFFQYNLHLFPVSSGTIYIQFLFPLVQFTPISCLLLYYLPLAPVSFGTIYLQFLFPLILFTSSSCFLRYYLPLVPVSSGTIYLQFLFPDFVLLPLVLLQLHLLLHHQFPLSFCSDTNPNHLSSVLDPLSYVFYPKFSVFYQMSYVLNFLPFILYLLILVFTFLFSIPFLPCTLS